MLDDPGVYFAWYPPPNQLLCLKFVHAFLTCMVVYIFQIFRKVTHLHTNIASHANVLYLASTKRKNSSVLPTLAIVERSFSF